MTTPKHEHTKAHEKFAPESAPAPFNVSDPKKADKSEPASGASLADAAKDEKTSLADSASAPVFAGDKKADSTGEVDSLQRKDEAGRKVFPPLAGVWTINLATGKTDLPPLGSEYNTLIIKRDFDEAAEEMGYDKLAKDDVKRQNFDKTRANAEKVKNEKAKEAKKAAKADKDADKAADKTATFTDAAAFFKFVLRHSPCPCTFVEVQCAESVEDAKRVILSLMPSCSLEQITEAKA